MCLVPHMTAKSSSNLRKSVCVVKWEIGQFCIGFIITLVLIPAYTYGVRDDSRGESLTLFLAMLGIAFIGKYIRFKFHLKRIRRHIQPMRKSAQQGDAPEPASPAR